MNISHALQILITAKSTAGPALKDAGKSIAGLAGTVATLGSALAGLVAVGVNASVAVASAVAAFVGAVAVGLVTALGAAVAGTVSLVSALATLPVTLSLSIGKTVEYAAELENMRRAMWTIAGEAAPAMLESLRQVTAYMKTERDLLKLHHLSYMLLGKDLTQRLPEAMQYLTKVAAATGEDVSYLTERLINSVGRLSTRWMAYIGTVVPLEEATKRATALFGKQAEELTYTEKQAGMLDGVLEKLRARTAALPEVLGTTTQMITALRVSMKDLWGELTTFLLPVARALHSIGIRVITVLRELISEGGALYGPIRKITATFVVLTEIFGELLDKILDVTKIGTSALGRFADHIISFAWKAVQWGANIITNLAIGMIKGASTALIAAMNFIAKLLASWLAPGSAPKIVSNILNWGASAFTEFLRGFTMAQFDVLEGVQAPLKRALGVLVDLGEVSQIEGFKLFTGLSEDLARALEEFGRTGKMAGDIFTKLSRVGGGYGESIAELLRRQLGLAKAVEDLARAEERLARARDGEEKANIKLSKAAREYNKLVRQGADPAVLKAKLAEVEASYDSLVAARDETKAAEEAEEAARERVKVQQEQVRLQERLLAQLIMMGEAFAALLEAQRKAAEEEELEIPIIEWPDIYPTPIDQAFEDLKNAIRKKFEDLWAELKRRWEESGVGKYITDLTERWNRFRTETLDPLLAKIEEMRVALVGWATSVAWPWILEQWDKWKAWWTENGPYIEQWLGRIAGQVRTWAVEHIWQWVLDEWNKWKAWWVTEQPKISELIGNITRSISDIFPPDFDPFQILVDVITFALDSVLIIASGDMERLRQTISMWLDILTGDWEGAFQHLENILIEWYNTANELSRGKLDELVAWFVQAWEDIKKSAEETWGEIEDWLAETWEEVKDKAVEVWEDIEKKAEEIWEDITAVIRKKLEDLFVWMRLDLDEMLARWTAIWEDIKLIVSTIVSRIVDWVVDRFLYFKGKLIEIWEGIKTFISTTWNAIYLTVSAIVVRIYETVVSWIQTLQAWWNSTWNAIKLTLVAIFGDMYEAVRAKVLEIYSAVTGKIQEIANWISGMFNTFWNLGYDIVMAIGSGIGAMAGWLLNKATRLVEDMIARMKRTLGLSSPSKVFAGFGRDVVRGFVEGIDELATAPALSLERMITLATAASVAPVSTGGPPAQSITIHNHFGRDSVRSDADVYKLAEQINRSLTLRGARGWS